MNNAQLVSDFIKQIWNRRDFSKLPAFLHPNFTDHGLPPSLPADATGIKQWIELTSASFEHKTVIDEQVTEGDKSIIKIRMLLRHIGTWRNIVPTGLEVEAVGYRMFRMQDDKIIEHWALIEGRLLKTSYAVHRRGARWRSSLDAIAIM